ncbi:DMT family transporter [Wenzhouxiangella sediminis]|uniref:EamA family transporter n=1 Tax=Wenzhouxiangella sediminis TaxID=1792836 RepID=A0A3E1KCE0_9GAMM|nr:EamA family transporter [Wenzhouxiangella sediminis]RFF32277.1 EamA family transporter [Wenzhouxiangella sediminis]
MKTFLLLALITVSEATIGVFVKLTDGHIPIHTLTFYAMSFAALFLFAARWAVTGQAPRFPVGNLKDTIVIGILVAAQGGFFNYAMSLVPIANAVIFWSVAPFFVFLFSWFFLGEKARPAYVAIFGLALIGIVLANPLGEGRQLGNLVALATGAIYAAMVTYMRYEGLTETGNDIAWSLLTAALALSPSLVLFGTGSPFEWLAYSRLGGLEVPVFVWALGLGVISTGFAYFGISIVLRSITANIYSLVDIIVSPVVAATLGWLVFAEMPGQRMIAGGALLLGAGFWLTREMSRGKEHEPVHACHISKRASNC